MILFLNGDLKGLLLFLEFFLEHLSFKVIPYFYDKVPHSQGFLSLKSMEKLLVFLSGFLFFVLGLLVVNPFFLTLLEELNSGVIFLLINGRLDKIIPKSSPSNSLQPEMPSLSLASGWYLKKVSLVLFMGLRKSVTNVVN